MTAYLAPQPVPQFFDNDGNPLAGGSLYTYQAGTSTPQVTYTTSAGGTPNANPIVLDAFGRCAYYLDPTLSYKLVLKDASGNTIWTADNLVASAPGSIIGSGGSSLVGFLQAGTGAVRDSVQDELRASFRLSQFLPAGVTEDNSTDLTTYVNTAIAACIAQGRYALELQGISVITDLITITTPITIWSKKGPKYAGFRQTTSNKGGLYFSFAALVQGGGIDGISVEAGAGWVTSGYVGSGSSGIGIKVKNSNGKFVANNYGIHNFSTAASVNGCYYTHWDTAEHFFCTNDALVIDTDDGTSAGVTGAGNSFRYIKTSNFGFSGVNTASNSVRIVASGGEYFHFVEGTGFNKGLVAKPSASKQVLYPFFSHCLFDTCVSDNWTFDGTDGKVWSVRGVDNWGCYSTGGAGLVTLGANLDGLNMVNFSLRENGKEGWDNQGGIDLFLTTPEIASNGASSANTYDGVRVRANVSRWAVLGGKIGNFASLLTGQANGIKIDVGASDLFRIVGADLIGAGAGKSSISNGSTAASWEISGNLPKVTVGTNTSSRETLYFGSAGTSVTAAGTWYIGLCGASTGGATFNPFVMSKPGVVTGFYVRNPTAPGTGKTFIYTVYLNGAATAMTGTISDGAFSVLVPSTNAFTVSATDTVAIQCVTLAGAAISVHSGGIFLEP